MRPLQIVATISLLSTLGLAAACSSSDSSTVDYPQRYVSALDDRAGVPVQEAHLAPFTAFITRIGSPDWETFFQGVYADQVHFSDTLAYIDDRETLRTYFAELADNGATVAVNILGQHRSGQDAYLIWEMTSSFTPVLATKQSHSIGVTHLRFNAAGEVILHQDFWDAATGFYQHVPMLGGALRGVRARIQPAP